MKPLGVIGVGLGICAVTGLVIGAYLWQRDATKSVTNSATKVVTNPTPAPSLVTWSDPAGFTFQYPEGLTVDKHDEDKDNYAHVEFTSSAHPGGLIVWAKDLPRGVGTLTQWVTSEKRFVGANMLDTTLGGVDAKKILISTPTKQLVTGTVSDNLLFTIEAALGQDQYWSGVHDTIASTFTFVSADKPAAADPANASGDDSEEPVDEEEVIQ